MRAVWRLSLALALFGAVTVNAELKRASSDAAAEGAAEEPEEEDHESEEREEQEEEDHMEGFEQDALSPEQLKGMHAKMDSNKDGKASLDEVMAYSDMMRKKAANKDIRSILDEMDTDKDGTLSMDEFLKDLEGWNTPGSGYGEDDEEAMGVPSDSWTEEDKKEAEARKKLEQEKFQLADTSGDGKLNIEELPSLFYPETHDGVLGVVTLNTLKAKDNNGDGKLTAKEFWEGDALDPEARDAPLSEEEEADFKKLDKNGDGFVELSEMKGWESGRFHTETAMRKMFELADKDSDNHVTAEELTNAREAIAGSDAQYHLMDWAEHDEL